MESIISKIKKCFALSKSSNPNEAAQALKMAMDLMQKHGVKMKDVEFSDVNEYRVKLRTRKPVNYLHFLASIIANSFGCEILYDRLVSGTAVTFIGIDPHHEIAGYCYTVLSRRLVSYRKAFIKSLSNRIKKPRKTKDADNYCLGWVKGVKVKIDALVPREIHPNIRAYMNEVYPATIKGKATDRVGKPKRPSDAMIKGYLKGQREQLHHPIDGMENLLIEN